MSDSEGRPDFLEDIFWDLTLSAGLNINYIRDDNRTTLGGLAGTTVSRTVAKIDENSVFSVYGRLSDDSFRVSGNAYSSSGTISFYGAEFDIDRAELEFDTVNVEKPAILTARARTVTYDDTTGVDTEIFLNINSIDRESGLRREASGRVEVRRGVSRDILRALVFTVANKFGNL